MKLLRDTCVLLYLFVSCHAWPRYGRPHPLYRGRQQTNENVLASAVLLGLDFNELQSLQAVDGQGIGLGNLGLPNNGFPMNARERQRARQDVNTLTAFGVIDGPEEAGPLGALVNPNTADPPDSAAADAKAGKKKGNKKPKPKGARKSKGKAAVKKNPGRLVKTHIVFQNDKPANTNSNRPKVPTTSQSVAVSVKNLRSNNNKAKKFASASTKKTGPNRKPVNKKKLRPQNRRAEGDNAENRRGSGGVPVRRRNKNRGKGGRQKFRAGVDRGEGRLAEQGGGDLLDRPLKGRGGRVVAWRTWGEEGR